MEKRATKRSISRGVPALNAADPKHKRCAAVRQARRGRDLTQVELARLSGMSQAVISSLERHGVGSLRALALLEECLGLDRAEDAGSVA